VTLVKVISGAQTGVDIAALDAAIENGFAFGGAVPKGRLWEARGEIPEKYFSPGRADSGLVESSSSRYGLRTRMNVRDSDATMLAKFGKMTPGSKLTFRYIREYERLYYLFDPYQPAQIPRIARWICENPIKVLNVAGSRESSRPGIEVQSRSFLSSLFYYVNLHQRQGISIWAHSSETSSKRRRNHVQVR